MIGIIDYGMGNIHSVRKAIEAMGAKTKVTNDPLDIKGCSKVVLPGVGAFKDAVSELDRRGLSDSLREYVAGQGKPFLGICLGMQVLFDSSQEACGISGLGLIKGKVERFPRRKGLKVPHMGWNQLKISAQQCPLLKGIAQGSEVYFCHSYYCRPDDSCLAAASCYYGLEFPALVWRDNIYAMQFHPEKSQSVGLAILKNFVAL